MKSKFARCEPLLPEETGAWFTVLEAANRVMRNPETIRRHIREKKLAASKRGNMWFIRGLALEPYLD